MQVEAFGQLSGAPAPQDCVRQPAEAAVIEGTYVLGSEAAAAARELLVTCGLPQRALPVATLAGGQQQLLVRREVRDIHVMCSCVTCHGLCIA